MYTRIRQLVLIVVVSVACLGGASAEAGLVKLTYVGNPLPLIVPPLTECCPQDPWPAFSGEIVLDESLLGGSIAGRTLQFFGFMSPDSQVDNTRGIVSWTLGVPLYSTAGTSVSITFGSSREVVGWVLDALDGPPDMYSTPSGDWVFGGDAAQYRADPGSWSTAVIPVPATGLLLVGGLGAVLALRGRKRA